MVKKNKTNLFNERVTNSSILPSNKKSMIQSNMTSPITRTNLRFGGAGASSLSTYTIFGFVTVIFGLIALIFYLIGLNFKQTSSNNPSSVNYPSSTIQSSSTAMLPSVMLAPLSTRTNPYGDPLSPPLKRDGMYFPPDSSDMRGIPIIPSLDTGYGATRLNSASTCNSNTCSGAVVPVGVPINMQTRGYSPEFSQIGILTHERPKKDDISFRDNMILPLFGRRVMNGRDKYQYYTMASMGATKLPIKVRGRNCINEYGCDELMNNDNVYVEGYNESFRATIYENSQFSYIPYL